LTAEIIAAGIATAFAAAACQSLTGFGFALVMTPIMALAWDAKSAVATSLLLSPVSVAIMLPEVHGRIPFGRVGVLFLGFLIGMPAGALLLRELDADTLRAVIAAVVVVAAVLLYFAPTLTGSDDGFLVRLIAGAGSGAVGASTSMSGPPLVLYLLPREPEVDSFRATTLALFMPTSLLSFAAAAIVGVVTTDVLVLAAACVPAIVVGLWLGRAARGRLDPERFRALVLVVLVATGAGVLASTGVRWLG
jgi:uncharacterized membrane protein YfcA